MFVLFFSLCLVWQTGLAKHIVGGELYYDYLGGTNYKITLKLYRDCSPGNTPYDSTAWIFIFNASNVLVDSVPLPFPGATQLPASVNSCSAAPTAVCVEEAVYTANKTLPSIPGGYTLVYQRCCRNNTILNIQNPGNTGATYTIQIPQLSLLVNSSPRYTNFPPIFICANSQLAFDNSATDPNGDSLVYTLCDAYDGASTCCPIVSSTTYLPTGAGCPATCPTGPLPPPYPFVTYTVPYSGSNPINALPAFSINSKTGLLTGTPTMIGQWVIAICVSEYRNGQLLSTNKRDFQFNVTACTPKAITSIPAQVTSCYGDTVHFLNNSLNATTYLWNFGDRLLPPDTSGLATPTHIYADSGSYQVILICNPGTPCADTGSTLVIVRPPIHPLFIVPAPECITGNSFNFVASGNLPVNSTCNWQFGLAAAPSSSTSPSPSNVKYLIGGTFPVTLSVQANGCMKTFTDSVQVFNVPVLNYTIPVMTGCSPLALSFTPPALASGYAPVYSWTLGDGAVSALPDPTHTYNQSGSYTVNLTVLTTRGCLDTFRFVGPLIITVNPNPEALFSADSLAVIIKNPLVHFTKLAPASDSCACFWNFGDGTTLNVCNDTVSHIFPAIGTYHVSEILTNRFGCTDTFTITIEVYSYFEYWIPNAFTPNGDGLNDIFKPVIEGVTNYEFLIFNRWGELIYSTDNIANGWDGTYKGNKCQEDVYVWKIEFVNAISRAREKYIGRVTLIR
jgi:gliding motility-associated-like protein